MTKTASKRWQELNEAIADAAKDAQHFMRIVEAMVKDAQEGKLHLDDMTTLQMDETAAIYAERTKNQE